jgi:signal transduction histidine kinase
MKGVSLRLRLTAWYCLAVLVAVSLFGGYVVWQQARIGLGRVDAELDDLTATLANVAHDELEEQAPAPEAESLSMVATPGKALAILDERGRPLAASWNGLPAPGSLPAADMAPRTWSTAAPPAWRVHTESRTFGDRRLVLLVGSPLSDVAREQRQARDAMLIAIPMALLLAAAGGLWLASVALRPITSMAVRASQIPLSGEEDLGESDRVDELGQLARAFNGLVARLRVALRTQRQFMADASHELRTPVSVLRSAADVTLARDHRDESEYREALSIVDGQTQRIGRLVEDMLVLARADAGGYPLRRESVYADELLDDVCCTVQGPAVARRITLRRTGATEVPLHGDEDLLRRMLLNLAQNAVRHAPEGSIVGLDLVRGPHGVEIRVTDEGAGIPAADRDRIFERFVQLDPSRREGGSGLGLPIARWIAEAHGGTLTLAASDSGRTTFLATFPPI